MISFILWFVNNLLLKQRDQVLYQLIYIYCWTRASPWARELLRSFAASLPPPFDTYLKSFVHLEIYTTFALTWSEYYNIIVIITIISLGDMANSPLQASTVMINIEGSWWSNPRYTFISSFIFGDPLPGSSTLDLRDVGCRLFIASVVWRAAQLFEFK